MNLEKRFSDAVELIESKPSDAVRAFTLMQVDALSVSPAVATALGQAIDAFRKGRDATLPLLRARRALSGEPAASSGLPAWSGAK
nr:SsuA_fam: ABC transporter, substrate-binding protein, aliphatic sulfonates [uncultured bacterium]